MSAPADRDASRLYYSYRIIEGGGGPSRSYAVSAPADRDASQLYYSYRIIKGGGGGGEILVVVTQCLLLPTGTHHSYTTHTVSLRGGGDPSRSYAVSAPADRDASQLYYSYRIIKGGGGGGDPSRSYAVSAPADRDASQLYYSYRIIKGGGGGGGGRARGYSE